MRKLLLLSLIIIPLLTGCDLLNKAKNIEISTQITGDIPVVATQSGKKSVEVTAGINAGSFTVNYMLMLSNNQDIEPYLSKIKDINLKSLVVSVTGLGAGQTINTMSLDVTGVGNIFTQNNITSANNSFTPVINTGKLDQVAAKLVDDYAVQILLTGTTSGPMTFTVSLNFDAVVTADAL